MLSIDVEISSIDKFICNSIDRLGASERGYLSQAILAHLRNLVEHIMLKVYANGQDIDNTYDNICRAIDFVKARGDLKFLRRFHDFLQIVASHYTLDEESSERLMLKYYEYLVKTRKFLRTRYSLDALGNLDKFPINTDSGLREYYVKIAAKLDRRAASAIGHTHKDRFYIQKKKPFFVGQKVYYEVTFTPANERVIKFDRIIAFTDLDISPYYAVTLSIVDDSIEILGKTMPILVIVNWEASIRPCEISNFAEIFGTTLKVHGGNSEYRELMQYLTETGFNLVELIDFPDKEYAAVKRRVVPNTNAAHFFDILDRCRALSQSGGAGSNVIRYLLYRLNNRVMKLQQDERSNGYLSGLYLKYGCIPFDKMPFNTSLINHNPKVSDLFEYIDPSKRRHEILARLIKNNIEIKGQLYTPIKDIAGFDDVDALVHTYNCELYSGHPGRRLETQSEHLYIRDYREDTLFIVSKLSELAKNGVFNYANSVISWLASSAHVIDCDEKKTALTQMFVGSMVALIYGSAGTGKSTLINHVSHFFSDKKKLYLANTNPAVDNLKRRVTASNCSFETVAKFLKRQSNATDYDILIIDECSTVSNRDMRAILEKASFTLLILIGDTCQIESIRFGNWFSVARDFIPSTSVFELTRPYRSNNKALIDLWNRVRNMDEAILEHIAKKGYSSTLDASIFQPAEDDEIILCLNYDGLYGINNINRFLQESNPNPAISCGIQLYKVNDPILFNESERFAPLIYNNVKGRIAGIEALGHQVQFDIELDKVINGMDAWPYDFDLLEDSPAGNSVIRFLVDKNGSTDEDGDPSSAAVVPFQVAYAVSIHKAQGLEYNSVKIVITDEIDELITHNILYTAITRAREKLKIYWTPEVEKKVLSNIKPRNNRKDVALLRQV